MKYVVILLFVGFITLALLFSNTVYGIIIPESTHELLEKSATIFVGNITATKVLQFEKQYLYVESENGIDKNIIKNYTLNLDEYTVNVDEYLKNPQNSTMMTVRQPIVGLPSGFGGLDQFKTGDHVLFYVENLDGNNTYSPESFIIPLFCNGKDVLTQKRPMMGNEFNVTQSGINVDYGNFTADEPIQFLVTEDMRTLFGKSFDVLVGISKIEGQNYMPIFNKEIHTKSQPCEWVALAKWGLTLKEGNYAMVITTKEGGNTTGTSYTDFSVRPYTVPTNKTSPLKQFQSGIPANKVTCNKGLGIIQKIEGGSPACVKPQTARTLIERGWGHLP